MLGPMRSQFDWKLSVTLIAVVTSLTLVGCNRRVFEKVKPTCDVTIASDVDIPDEKAADILIVVDNSGSMQEEQDRLAAAFINTTASCPIGVDDLKDFARCGEDNPPAVCEFANPTPEVLAAPGPNGLANCGFIQVLAAFENDFRIGVITSDVGECDNRVPGSQANLFCQNNANLPECQAGDAGNPWGFRPQRGCLQPNGPPGTSLKVIARQDLLDADPNNDDIGQRFIDTLSNVRTFGSAVERGLDAMEVFLDPNSVRSAGCDDDLNSFIRDDAKLIVIFLTDEEDCSRAPDVGGCEDTSCAGECDSEDGCEIFGCPEGQTCELGRTEFTGETCGNFIEHFTDPLRGASRCYDLEGRLTPVSHYVSFLKGLKANPSDVTAAVIAGGLPDSDGEIQGAGCTFDPNNGQTALGGCVESKGNSNGAGCQQSGDCCFADPGDRYFDFADDMGGLKDTICVNSFATTMIKIAVFIADVDFIKLAERPENPALVFVEKTLASSGDVELVTRLNGTTCGNANGWVLEEDGVTVRFCGDARPGPGETIRVRAKGAGAESEDADACANR